MTYHKRKSEQEFKVETEAEAMKYQSLLACSPFLSLLFYSIQDHLPRSDTTHSILGHPPLIQHQKMLPVDLSIGQSHRVPCYQVTLVYIKLTKN